MLTKNFLDDTANIAVVREGGGNRFETELKKLDKVVDKLFQI